MIGQIEIWALARCGIIREMIILYSLRADRFDTPDPTGVRSDPVLNRLVAVDTGPTDCRRPASSPPEDVPLPERLDSDYSLVF